MNNYINTNINDNLPLDYNNLIELLKNKNLIIDDIAKTKSYLLTIGYSRLKRYFKIFYDNNNETFIDNFSFEDLLNIYVFDRKLRGLFIEALERIEIAVKNCLFDTVALDTNNVYFIYDKSLFNPLHYDSTLRKIGQVILHRTDKNILNGDMKCWGISENITFGNLCFIYNCLISKYREMIANMFRLNNKVMSSWLLSIALTRNICAHFSILWSRIFSIQPINLKNSKTKETIIDFKNSNNKLFAQFYILSYFMKQISPNTTWIARVLKLIEEYQNKTSFIKKSIMGFPEDYDEMMNKI